MPTFVPHVYVDWDNSGTAAGVDTVDACGPWTIDGAPGSPTDTIDGAIDGSGGVVPSQEEVTPDVRLTSPITVKFGRDVARELAPIRAGTLDFLLGNETGLYSSRNPASPLYGQVK